MKHETLLFGRLGNKTNDIKYFREYLPLDVVNVIEPFGGTFAVSRIVYSDPKYKKYVNDSDPLLTNIYEHPQEFCDFKIKMNDIALKHYNKEKKYVMTDNFFDDVKKRKDIDQNSMFYKYWLECEFVRRQVKKVNEVRCDEQIKFMRGLTFTNNDYKDVIERHKGDSKAFIFLDPPYLFSNNKQYYDQNGGTGDTDMTDIIVYLLELFKDSKCKAKVMIIINGLKLLRYLFKGFVKGEYTKCYQMTKKKEQHLIICNY